MAKGKKQGGRRVNRILGFAGPATDEELDEVIELTVRFVNRMFNSKHFVQLLELGANVSQVTRRYGLS